MSHDMHASVMEKGKKKTYEWLKSLSFVHFEV